MWGEFLAQGSPDEIPPGHVVALVSSGTVADLGHLCRYLALGGNPNIDDDKGNSLLARAVAGGRVDFVRFLGACYSLQGGGHGVAARCDGTAFKLWYPWLPSSRSRDPSWSRGPSCCAHHLLYCSWQFGGRAGLMWEGGGGGEEGEWRWPLPALLFRCARLGMRRWCGRSLQPLRRLRHACGCCKLPASCYWPLTTAYASVGAHVWKSQQCVVVEALCWWYVGVPSPSVRRECREQVGLPSVASRPHGCLQR